MEMTREQFIEELSTLKESRVFNLESNDSGSVHFALYGCKVDANLEDGIEGEITVFKPYSNMDITLDFAIIDTITKEDDSYRLEFNNGMSDVIISIVA